MLTNGTEINDPDLFGAGGGIESHRSDLLLSRMLIHANQGPGIAIFADSQSQTVIRDSLILNNETQIDGGGIRDRGGDLTILNTTIAGNIAQDGGGIWFDDRYERCPVVNIMASTISNNYAVRGGGLEAEFGTQEGCDMNFENVTISRNSAGAGGGIWIQRVNLMINFSTIANNTASGLDAYGWQYGGGMNFGEMTGLGSISNSIVAGNMPDNCGSGSIPSGGYNIEDSDSCGFRSSEDRVNTDPLLGPLVNNGGPTGTHALLQGSPAINAAYSFNQEGCYSGGVVNNDQRGVVRPQGDGCDIGAYESEEMADQPAPTQSDIEPTQAAPTPQGAPTVTSTQNANCRLGPSPAYGVTSSLLAGQTAPISGRNTDSSWWVIQIPGSGECWIWGGTVTVAGDTSQVPVKTPPPLPTATFTQPAPLNAPSPISPSGTLNCADVTGGVTLSWSAVSHPNGIDHYEWALEGGLNNSGSTSSTQTVISLINCGTSYQWHVRAVDGQGNIGPWSSYMKFNVP